MFSTIIVNDSKPNEKPECLQGDMVLVVAIKKVGQGYESATALEISKKSEIEMQTFVNLGIAVRDMIDTMYRDNKKGRKLALKLFTEGFNKTMGESTILKIREEGRHLNE